MPSFRNQEKVFMIDDEIARLVDIILDVNRAKKLKIPNELLRIIRNMYEPKVKFKYYLNHFF